VKSNVRQNRLAIALARQCLQSRGFTNVNANRPQGTFPHAHITASGNGVLFLIGVTSREEMAADGQPRPTYNLVQTADDLERAQEMADEMQAVPAFVAVALRSERGEYDAYFGTLQVIQSSRTIPMLRNDRRLYETLAEAVRDNRVAELLR
jgi:hypothetical protein